MSVILADRVQETTTTTGTGTLDLAGAATGHQTFVAGAGDGAEVYYVIVGQAGGGAEGEWEVGIGTVTDAATDTLSRDTVLSSSNSGSAVNLSAGTKDVFLTQPAGRTEMVLATASPSSAATVDFVLSSGFKSFRLVGWALPATDSASLRLRFSNDGGSTFRSGSTDYHFWYIYNQMTGTATGESRSTGGASTLALGLSAGNASGEGYAFDVTIIDPLASARYTAVVQSNVMSPPDGTRMHIHGGGMVNAAAEANDAVRVLFSSGNIASGEISLIGIP